MVDINCITKFILEANPQNLTKNLPALAQWTPEIVHKILKRLWNHGPKALEFFKILDAHHSYSHSATAFDYTIDIAGRMRDYKTLWTLVDQMKARNLGPSPKTFAIILERYVSSGKADKATDIFLSMHQHGCPQDLNSFNAFLDVLCKAKRAEKAYNLLKLFGGRFRSDVFSYNIVTSGFCLIKRTPKALNILKEMVEKRGLEPNVMTYNIMLNGFFRAGQIKEAWKFFLQMKRRKCEIDVVTYTTMVHGFGVAGDVEKSQALFDEMVQNGVLPSVATYNALIQVLCKKDNVENALSALDQMMRKGYVPNITTFNVVIRGLCHAGMMGRAVEYIDRMEDSECEPNVQTYNLVIRYYCNAGDIDKALEFFGKMGRELCLPNLDTYNILISAMFVRKRSDDLVVAAKLLIEMTERGFLPRKFNFNRVLNGLLLTGNQEFAREILRLQSRFGRVPRHFRL
ncbi:OLC1v1004544C4 [Oldenlandia corymbosa var. corymbosa]|uniref:OLC1v1004544C4 n=1 Tax=Oldenlandia corymbosa var. corymbosa TaxID=529605 RepID=A0AAV1DCI8_OLDCO|nr:OLC1v1004544C4 [Oldenlandia corymbosa var. corymbosa]